MFLSQGVRSPSWECSTQVRCVGSLDRSSQLRKRGIWAVPQILIRSSQSLCIWSKDGLVLPGDVLVCMGIHQACWGQSSGTQAHQRKSPSHSDKSACFFLTCCARCFRAITFAMLRASASLGLSVTDKMVLAIKHDLSQASLHQIVHPVDSFMTRLSGFLILWGDFKGNYQMTLKKLMQFFVVLEYHSFSLLHCLPLLPNNYCLLWRTFVLSISIAVFFSLPTSIPCLPLKTAYWAYKTEIFQILKLVWLWVFFMGSTWKYPLHEGDCLSCPSLYHLLLLPLCQMFSAEQMKVKSFSTQQ